MKILTKTILDFAPLIMKRALLCFMVLFTFSNTKAQNDANCGILVDGILADSISNWNFKQLSVVFPKTSEWNKYDLIMGFIVVEKGSEFDEKSRLEPISWFSIKPEDMKSFNDAEYVVYNLWHNGADKNLKRKQSVQTYCPNYKMENYGHEEVPPEKRAKSKIWFYLKGYKKTGYLEELAGSTLVKEPLYENGNTRDYTVRNLNYEKGTLLYKSNPTKYKMCYCYYENKKAYLKTVRSNQMPDGSFYPQLQCTECQLDESKPPFIAGKKFNLSIEKVDNDGKFEKIKK